MKQLRRCNRVISAILILLIVIHGIMGSFKLLGIGTHAGMIFAWIGFILLIIHSIIGLILTLQTIRIESSSKGKLYLKQNATFWTKRFTGIAIICSLYFHFGMFSSETNGTFVLLPFTTVKLIAMLTLVVSVFIHIFVNIRSLFVSMGILVSKEKRIDIFVFLSVILVFISVSLILYYISWSM